ncbi:MAG: hypothetical protein BWY28_02868 [bacterium ADurb.Bin236]|nr:MAG: hypothetical protein BWY28_02868 [bacterium ADurb.Bin236]
MTGRSAALFDKIRFHSCVIQTLPPVLLALFVFGLYNSRTGIKGTKPVSPDAE